jgi:adenine-specific DNA-methyltransferase
MEMLSEAALSESAAVFRPTEIDEGGASRETVEVKRQSLLSPETVFEQQRPGLPPRYVRNGQEMTFLKKKVREIDGRPVFTTMATNIWTDIAWEGIANEGGVTLKQGKKPERLVERLIDMFTHEGQVVCDFFAGSGTTCGVAIKTGRRFLGVEAAPYFDSVLLPRIKRAVRGDRTGVGKNRTHVGKGLVKYLRLESYEDTLNNLVIHRDEAQKSLLDEPAAKGDGKLREQYLLKYMLDVETRGSQSLLNVAAFRDPMAYRLSVKRPGSDESLEVCVDLLETFNWLIGLTVEAIAAPQLFSAAFERDAEQRLQLKGGRIKADPKGPFWFRRVEGKLADGRKALIVWRKLGDDLEQANLVLDHFLTEKLKISTKDFEFDVIYVNGSNNLENLKAPDDTWKVRLLEEEFHRLMFATEDV